MDEKDQRNWAMFIHLAGLCNFIGLVPGSLVVPLVLWQMKKDEAPFIDEHGKEAVNFQITILIYAAISGVLLLVLIGIPMLLAVALLQIVGSVWAAIRASKGEEVFYPMTFRFVK